MAKAPISFDMAWEALYEHRLDLTVQGCIITRCRRWRSALWRIWDTSLPLWGMVLLNPSKATHEKSDPTITRQQKRTAQGGAGGLVVFNSDAIMETNRLKAVKLAGQCPDNDFWITWLATACDKIIVGWGPDAKRFEGDKRMMDLLAGRNVYALGINADGSPRHPLYVSCDAPLIPYKLGTSSNVSAQAQKRRAKAGPDQSAEPTVPEAHGKAQTADAPLDQ